MNDYPCKECLVKVQCFDRKEFCSQLNESVKYIQDKLYNLEICPDCESTTIIKNHSHYLCSSCNHQFFIDISFHKCRSIRDKIIFQDLR